MRSMEEEASWNLNYVMLSEEERREEGGTTKGIWREEEGWNAVRGMARNPMRGVEEDSLHPTINPPAKAILLDRVGLKAF